VVAEEGWTKAGMDKMLKLDSFLRETQRLEGTTILSLNRLALSPFTFSNGMTVPAGTYIAVPMSAAHRDERIHAHADEFDGFRFTKLRESEGDAPTSRHHGHMVSTSTEQLSFGLGRHACPGRFFAANEVKALFAHILVTYEFKLEDGKGVPREICFASVRIPGTANVMFRTRRK